MTLSTPPERASLATREPASERVKDRPGIRLRRRSSVPKLVLVGPLPPPISGQAMAFQSLVEELRKHDVEASVVPIGSKQQDRPANAGVTMGRVLELVRPYARFLRSCGARPTTTYLQLAQSWAGFLRDVPFIWTAWLFRHRIVVHLHGGNYDGFYRSCGRLQRRLIRSTLRRTQHIVVLSERLQGMFDFDEALRSKTVVVGNGLDALPPDAEAKRIVRGQPLRVAYVSGMIKSKGYETLLEAVALLNQRHGLHVEAEFAGAFIPEDDRAQSGGSAAALRTRFEARVAEAGLQDKVTIHGVVSNERKADILRRCHAFVLPTRYPHEGQPISILEAMSFGAVVVATDYRAIPDMVTHEVTGLLCPGPDPTAFADALAKLAADPERLNRMSRAAMDDIRKRWMTEQRVEPLLRLLLDNETRFIAN